MVKKWILLLLFNVFKLASTRLDAFVESSWIFFEVFITHGQNKNRFLWFIVIYIYSLFQQLVTAANK